MLLANADGGITQKQCSEPLNKLKFLHWLKHLEVSQDDDVELVAFLALKATVCFLTY